MEEKIETTQIQGKKTRKIDLIEEALNVLIVALHETENITQKQLEAHLNEFNEQHLLKHSSITMADIRSALKTRIVSEFNPGQYSPISLARLAVASGALKSSPERDV